MGTDGEDVMTALTANSMLSLTVGVRGGKHRLTSS